MRKQVYKHFLVTFLITENLTQTLSVCKNFVRNIFKISKTSYFHACENKLS